MYTQPELLNLIGSFGEKITAQTLRNYIKAGVCEGAYNEPTGISTRGLPALYYRRTAFQAVIAKRLRLLDGKKYYMKELAFSYSIADKIMTDSSINIVAPESFLKLVYDYFGKDAVELIRADRNTSMQADVLVKIDDKVVRRATDLKNLLGEWLLLMAGLVYYDLYDCSKGAIPPISSARKVFVEADEHYSIERIDSMIYFAKEDKLNEDYVTIRPKKNTIKYKSVEWYYK